MRWPLGLLLLPTLSLQNREGWSPTDTLGGEEQNRYPERPRELESAKDENAKRENARDL